MSEFKTHWKNTVLVKGAEVVQYLPIKFIIFMYFTYMGRVCLLETCKLL